MGVRTDFDDKLDAYREKVQAAIEAGASVLNDVLCASDGATAYRQDFQDKLVRSVPLLVEARSLIK